MIRTQILLTEEQDRALGALARAEDASKGALVRRAVDLLLSQQGAVQRQARRDRTLGAIGMVRGDGAPVSQEHDRYLTDAFAGEGSRG
ncbi:MAG TPA: CopG family transcriptional regulator [Chloroflexota bacterium]|nr:CopG family transcriptional regulator [Chloroflexota bacterium]